MRYSREHKEETRTKIVRAAAKRFRSRGSEGAVIGDLMHDLRLTHGGFYRHFHSKEELFGEAFDESLKQTAQHAQAALQHASQGGELKALIDGYLSIEHSGDLAGGCPVAALITEISRRPEKLRSGFLRRIIAHADGIAKYVPGRTAEERNHKARFLLSGMAGTLNVARLFTDLDERETFLAGARKFYFEAVTK